MTKLNLDLLGGFRLCTDTGESVALPTKKAWALLAYLALHPGRAQARPKLAALLWGDRTDVQARDSLRQALTLVRKALSRAGAQALIAHADTITFEPTILNIDVVVFEDLLAQPGAEMLEQAIGVYGGEFLEGFQVRAPEFESWATAERQRLREMALAAMAKLLDHHLAAGAIDRSIHIGARLLAADPLDERVHRTLMELYWRRGRIGAALRQYRPARIGSQRSWGSIPTRRPKHCVATFSKRGTNSRAGPQAVFIWLRLNPSTRSRMNRRLRRAHLSAGK
jgi:DNA-binding SARP family transcriptional activator